MITFLNRLVSRALTTGADAVLKPRLDAGIASTSVTYGDAMHGELDTVGNGEEETERVTQPSSAQRGSTGALMRPPVETPAGSFPTKRPRFVGEAAADVLRDAEPPSRPVRPATSTSHHATRAPQPDRTTAPAPVPTAQVVGVIREAARRDVARHVVRERQSIVAPASRSSGPPSEETLLTVGSHLERRAATNTSANEGTRARDREPSHDERWYPTTVVPRAAIDRGVLPAMSALAPASNRRAVDLAGARDAAPEHTTVHVTIGRLEIRAPQPAPAVVPRPAHTARERTLETYLEKRASKGPR